MQPATFTLRRHLSGKTLKAWRKAHNLSAHALAVELGVSRAYIKSIEGGSLAASQKLIQRFDGLRGRMGEGIREPVAPKPIIVISRFQMPPNIEILAKPRRCKGCRRFFIPITPNQKMHNSDACQRAARQTKPRKGLKR